jgi:hypothetical protein
MCRHFTARREKHIIIKLDEIFGQAPSFLGLRETLSAIVREGARKFAALHK